MATDEVESRGIVLTRRCGRSGSLTAQFGACAHLLLQHAATSGGVSFSAFPTNPANPANRFDLTPIASREKMPHAFRCVDRLRFARHPQQVNCCPCRERLVETAGQLGGGVIA